MFFFIIDMISLQYKMYKKYKQSVCENNELKKSKTYLEQELKILKESLSQASTFGTTDEPSIIEKLREEVACLTKDFGNFLESYNNLSMLHKYH